MRGASRTLGMGNGHSHQKSTVPNPLQRGTEMHHSGSPASNHSLVVYINADEQHASPALQMNGFIHPYGMVRPATEARFRGTATTFRRNHHS